MTIIWEHWELVNVVIVIDRRRNGSKMFWQLPCVHGIVARKAYVEKKRKSSRTVDNTNIANTNARPSVNYAKTPVWFRNPQREPSPFLHEVSAVDILILLKWNFLILRRNLRLILINMLYKYGLICFCSSTYPHVVEVYSGRFKNSNQSCWHKVDT